jgi:4-amino-4-deoxy-L-arabinose transferase-like glycosyltransferase
MVHPGYRKRTIVLLFAVLLIRFWYGQTFELSGQEAYLWLQGHGANLSPAYWERGPMLPLLIRIGTAFFGDTELGVRWLAAVICCGSGFVLFYLARRWFDARAAFWTVVLFLVIPIFAWKLSYMTEASVGIGLMALAMFGFDHGIEDDRWYWWLLGGVACGMALLVAPSYALWPIGVLAFLAFHPDQRHILREPGPWISLLVAALFITPLVWWWHGAQVSDVIHQRVVSSFPLSQGFSFHHGFHFLGLEIFYLCPIFFILLVIALCEMGRELWENPRYALLLWLSVPGLLWQNLDAFFGRSHFDLVPALFLPIVLIAGCHVAKLAEEHGRVVWLAGIALVCALLQTLAGLSPFAFVPKPDGGYVLKRSRSGNNIANFHSHGREISWRNLAEAVRTMQADQGATLLITDSPETAAALSFYLPHNPLVYVQPRNGVITQFDFWNSYVANASPNDSALYIARSTNPAHPADAPSEETQHNFANVQALDDPPLPEFDKAWDIWICQNFIGSGNQSAAEAPSSPMHESLPTK